MNFKKINFNKNFWLLPSLVAGVLTASFVFAETWQGAPANPTSSNQDKPINEGSGTQTRAGELILSNSSIAYGALNMRNDSILYFGDNYKVGLRAPYNSDGTSALQEQYILELPVNGGTNNDILTVSATSSISSEEPTLSVTRSILEWKNAGDLDIIDYDWQYSLINADGGYGLDNIDYIYTGNERKVGIGNSAPVAQLDIQANENNVGLNIKGAVDQNTFNIQDSTSADVFTVSSEGILTAGIVPWARLSNVPEVTCASNQVIRSFINGTFECANVDINLGNLIGGNVNQTIRHNGTNWEATSSIYNTGSYVGIGSGFDINTQSNGFSLIVNGNVGPANGTSNLGSASNEWNFLYASKGIFNSKLYVGADSTSYLDLSTTTAQFNTDAVPTRDDFWSLGSSTLRWRHLFVNDITANSVSITGALTLSNRTPHSVLFIDSQKMVDENNDYFYWDYDSDRLGLGLGQNVLPETTLDVGGSMAMPFTDLSDTTDGVSLLENNNAKGVLYLVDGNGQYLPFLHTIGGATAYNIFLGYNDTGFSATPGYSNIGIGAFSLITNLGNNNTAIGVYSLNQNTSGSELVAIGYQALYSNTEGGTNVGLGYQSLTNNTIGSNNIGIGKQAMPSNVETNNNIAVGYQAFFNLSAVVNDSESNGNNVGIGYQVGYNSGNIEKSVYIGSNAGYTFKGYDNVLIGRDSGSQDVDNTSYYNNNIYIGSGSGYKMQGDKNIMIGNNAYIASSGNRENVVSNVFLLNNATSTNFTQSLLFGKFYDNGTTDVPSLRVNGAIAAVTRSVSETRMPSATYDFMQGGVYGDNYHTFSNDKYYRGKTMDSTASCSYNGANYDWLFFKEGLLICKLSNSTTCAGQSPTLTNCCGNNNENCPD